MKKRKNTPQPDAAQAISSPPARDPIEAPSANKIAGEIPIITAPRLADASARSAAESPRSPLPLDQAKSEPQPHARREPPALPRVATLGAAPASALRIEAAAPTASARAPVATPTERRPRRFALLAACVALSAGLGALGGSFAVAEIGRLLAAPPPPVPPPVHADASEDIRALKDSIAQLRGNLKTIGDNVAAVRAGLNASFSSSTAQFAKIAEAIEKLEHHQPERHAAAAPPSSPPPESTGSIAAATGAKPEKPGVVDGWVLRKAYRGAALVEGRYGIIEIEPGDHLPGVGRVEEIKRQDGRWVVVTPKGLIVGMQ